MSAPGAASEFRSSDAKALKERWRAYVQDRRLNVTAQREAIVEQFLRTRDHVSIDELLLKVRKRHPKVGYATVYRTLKLLTECGLAAFLTLFSSSIISRSTTWRPAVSTMTKS